MYVSRGCLDVTVNYAISINTSAKEVINNASCIVYFFLLNKFSRYQEFEQSFL